MTDSLCLRIECKLKSFYCKRRFPVSEWSLGRFRLYVGQLVDIKVENLIIVLHAQELSADADDNLLCNIESLYEHDTIVIDSRCPADDVDDVNRLPDKYRMSDAAYAQRAGTLRDFMQRNKLGKYSDFSSLFRSTLRNNRAKANHLAETNRLKLKQLDIGMHVQVNEPTSTRRYGEVVYIGMLRGIYDEFVGVVFDAACGDSNGSDGFIQYFDAKRKHASFVRPEYIELVGKENNADFKK